MSALSCKKKYNKKYAKESGPMSFFDGNMVVSAGIAHIIGITKMTNITGFTSLSTVVYLQLSLCCLEL